MNESVPTREQLIAELARLRAQVAALEANEQKRSEGRRGLQDAALDAVANAIVITDRTGLIQWVNPAFSVLTGYAAAEAIGKNPRDLVKSGKHDQAFYKNLWDTVLAGEVWRGETINRRKDGSLYTEDQTITPVRDAQGVVSHFIAVKQDVTERARLEAALRASEERMRFAMEAACVGMWDMDRATGTLQWSQQLEAQYGLAPGTFGRTFPAFIELIHPADRDAVLATIADARGTGTDFTLRFRTIWPDGTTHWIYAVGREYFGPDGQPVRDVGISLDVTATRRLEEQYQQAQKMEAVGRLAGGVAHDFNNLLTVILGFCELLLPDIGPDDPRHADLVEIQKAGTRAAGLTRQLLAFSRKQIIEPTVLDLNHVIAEMQPMLVRLIGEDVLVEMKLTPRMASVKADRGQVEQVVMNLAVNARDAMPTGGRLTLETADDGPRARLTVTDTGTGMTADVKAHLFEPFFTTKGLGKGTGLGLATVRDIVTRSGGTVNVVSDVGKGTAFTVYFPKAAADVVVDVPVTTGAARRTDRRTVLIVDDVAGLRDLVKRLLERQGYAVLAAANAAEARRLFDRNPSIDLILTDVVMPGESGPVLTKRLLEQRPALKVIYMSGYTDDTVVQHGLEPGIAFLPKPFTSETLGRKIREMLDK